MINLDPPTTFDDSDPEVIHVQLKVSDGDVTVTSDKIPVIQPRDLEIDLDPISGDDRQNNQRVFCNGNTVSLAGTSPDNYLVVESPNYPFNYPTYLWFVVISSI